ncbi:hypothetical protein L3Q67_25225 [Saccharothrix sp. AJ9571]|nr:hypothetical protein L3Q67_25225 [Saccharothrix sp. AJ9571]
MTDQSPATEEAVGKISAAFETIERARGALYTFHQLTGTADFALEEGIDALRQAGHHDLAADLERELLGRNVLPGRWTFQVVEDYDDTYYEVFREYVARTRELTGGERHSWEARLKRQRRTPAEPGHELTPEHLPD